MENSERLSGVEQSHPLKNEYALLLQEISQELPQNIEGENRAIFVEMCQKIVFLKERLEALLEKSERNLLYKDYGDLLNLQSKIEDSFPSLFVPGIDFSIMPDGQLLIFFNLLDQQYRKVPNIQERTSQKVAEVIPFPHKNKNDEDLSQETLQKIVDSHQAKKPQEQGEMEQRIQEFFADVNFYLSRISSFTREIQRVGYLNISSEEKEILENLRAFLSKESGWSKIQYDAEGEAISINNNVFEQCDGVNRELLVKFEEMLSPTLKKSAEYFSKKMRGESLNNQSAVNAGLTDIEANERNPQKILAIVSKKLDETFPDREIPLAEKVLHVPSLPSDVTPQSLSFAKAEWRNFEEAFLSAYEKDSENLLLQIVGEIPNAVLQLLDALAQQKK